MFSPRGLKIDQRRKRILAMLARKGQVWVSELSAELGTTPVTIRSDLAALSDEGLLERVSGGAVMRVRNGMSFVNLQAQKEERDVKLGIALAAAKLIEDGETLFINSGTTAYFAARELKFRKNLKVVTNSIPVALELGDVPGFRVILLGGEINTRYSFTYGQDAVEQLKCFRADKTVLSMDGISAAAGLTTYHAEEAVVNRVMMERSTKTIIVAAGRKIGFESFSFVANLSSVAYLVTDSPGNNQEAIDELKRTGLNIVSVP